jgi:eukaryotic-like serine/threonine-protein kinase
MIGQRLLHYEIVEKLGEGGMGVVYRARDTKLGRDVALKFLPEAFTSDPDRLARFEREAKALASLNHPHVAAIYGLDEAGGTRFLVMEMVEGETLAQRISRGLWPVAEALEVGRQIAEGLEAAHNKGVIHRDLKPSNVKVTAEGEVKILDFGLAKALHEQSSGAATEDAPTITGTRTRPGVILGTAAYMAPEQAKGKAADKRVDVWAFGCVLYECLTGRRVFEGESITEVLARILESEPDWSVLPKDVPAGVRTVLEWCLRKDPSKRLRDLGDARLQLEAPVAGAAPIETRRGARWLLAAGLLGGLAGIAVALLVVAAIRNSWQTGSSPASPVSRFAIHLREGESIATAGPSPAVALSPDGTRLAYVAQRGTARRIHVRYLDRLAADAIPGTQDAEAPFFSPDGNWVGFHAKGKLMRVPLLGGAPHTICETTLIGAACWRENDTIVFSGEQKRGLWQVAASGGEPRQLTTAPRGSGERREMQHVNPHRLPGARGMLFTVQYLTNSAISEFSFETGKYRTLIEPGGCAHYASPGYLVYVLAGKLMAVPFAPQVVQKTGSPVALAERVRRASYSGAHFSVSRNGTLAYVPGSASPGPAPRLLRVDPTGKVQALPFPPGRYQSPRISPDGERLVAVRSDPLPRAWIYGLRDGSMRRLTDDRGEVWWAAWSPDGKEIAFNRIAAGSTGDLYDLYVKLADGSRAERRLTTNRYVLPPTAWADGGKSLIVLEGLHPDTGFDIVRVSAERGGTPQPILNTRFNEWNPAISPSGRWLAYVSDESKQPEIYVRPYPGPGDAVQETTDGGREPVWDPSGKALYYRDDNGDKVFKTPIQTGPALEVGRPALLFEGRFQRGSYWGRSYDISPKGDFFVMIAESESEPATQINVVLNWSEELKRLAVNRP